MLSIAKGLTIQFVFLIIFFIILYYYIRKSLLGKAPPLRKLPAVDALDEGLGRAVEMGKTVMFTHGTGTLESSESAGSLAAIAVLPYIAKRCAELDLQLYLPTGSHTAYNVLLEILRESCLTVGKPELFNPNNVIYLSSESRAYSAGVMSTLMTRNVGAAIMLGSYHHAGLMLVETANRVGAISVGGTDSTSQIPWFVAGCDYSLIGEEIYALGAYISKEPISHGAIVGQDMIKMLIIIILVFGVLLTQLGLDVAKWFTI
jgi:hypothetical protein